MAITLPTSVDTTDVDSATDDPKLARADILDLMQKFNTLLGQINALGIMQVGDGIEQVVNGAGVKDAARVKLDGTSLTRSAAGIKVNAQGVKGSMLDGSATDTPGNSKYYGTNGSGARGFFLGVEAEFHGVGGADVAIGADEACGESEAGDLGCVQPVGFVLVDGDRSLVRFKSYIGFQIRVRLFLVVPFAQNPAVENLVGAPAHVFRLGHCVGDVITLDARRRLLAPAARRPPAERSQFQNRMVCGCPVRVDIGRRTVFP